MGNETNLLRDFFSNGSSFQVHQKKATYLQVVAGASESGASKRT
jgi:hypothetical protein